MGWIPPVFDDVPLTVGGGQTILVRLASLGRRWEITYHNPPHILFVAKKAKTNIAIPKIMQLQAMR